MLATPITYSASAIFSGPDFSAGDLTNGGATIAYTGVPSTSVNTPTNINLGLITVSGGSGSFAGDTIQLTISQTAPSLGSQATSSTIDGTVTSTSNGIDVVFAPTTFSIGQITYTLESSYFLVSPNTNQGETTLQASVSAPEPPTILLGLGAGLCVFGFFRRSQGQEALARIA